MLLQGGIPITHISNNSGAYKNFLLRILELQPNTIDDFAFKPEITSLLPRSSRNDAIYESCLEIVKAIINEDEQFLLILNKNQELQSIRNELRIKSQTLQTIQRKSKFKTAWVMEPEKKQIRLYLNFPETIEQDVFVNLFFDDNSTKSLDYEYKLYISDMLFCKFKKKVNESYRTIWISQKDFIWDGSENLPETYLIDTNGDKVRCKNLVTNLPKLNMPSLWASYSDLEWILEKGTHTNHEEGFILAPISFVATTQITSNNIELCGRHFIFFAFKNSIELNNNGIRVQFKTDSKKIEWFIVEDKPNWIKKANYPIVSRRPKLLVYDQENNRIPSPRLQWRQKPNLAWLDWNAGNMAQGLTEVKISVNDIFEVDEFFNLGNLGLKISSNRLQSAEIELVNNQFVFSITEDTFVNITRINPNKFKADLKNNNVIPKAILASVRYREQAKVLRFEVLPPFKGVEILDNENNIVPNLTGFNINDIYGYRLMSNDTNLVANIYNNKLPNIIISNLLSQTHVPLREFEDKILQLTNLSDAMDNEAEIVLEICEERNFIQTKLREYKFRKYNNSISWIFDEASVVNIAVDTKNCPDLYAVPLDCDVEYLVLYDLVNHGEHYKFRELIYPEKFIVFSNKDSATKIQPAFVSINPDNKFTTLEDRVKRILVHKNKLLESEHRDEPWQKLLIYYKICIDNNLPFSAFDILRSLAFSSEVAAKAYVFFTYYDENQTFVEENYRDLEDDIGFSFHWISKNDWNTAMRWIGCFDDNEDLFQLVFSGIKSHFENLYPSNNFKRTSNFILQDIKPSIDGSFHFNSRVTNLRGALGARVLNELPKKCPKVPEVFKNVLSVSFENASVKILLKSPLAVALSITGKDDAIWSEEYEEIRRNIKYAQQLNPEWYSEAINYCLNKI